jgi:peptidoglycan/xylan/chitin deacetylase (PgdA/CDA1 family)
MRPGPLLGAAALAAGGGWWGPGAAVHVPPLAALLRVPRRLEGEAAAGGVALTFDDGPHPQGTPAVMAALERAGAHATFFLVGEQAQRYPELVCELLAAGHDLAVHAFRHRIQLRLTARAVADDLERASAVLGQLSGRRLRVYRPPYGAFTAGGLAAVRRAGLEPLLWSRWGRDWRRSTTPAEIARLTTARVRAGDVILLHDADHYCDPGAWRCTVAALPRILAELERRELRPVRLGSAA